MVFSDSKGNQLKSVCVTLTISLMNCGRTFVMRLAVSNTSTSLNLSASSSNRLLPIYMPLMLAPSLKQ